MYTTLEVESVLPEAWTYGQGLGSQLEIDWLPLRRLQILNCTLIDMTPTPTPLPFGCRWYKGETLACGYF